MQLTSIKATSLGEERYECEFQHTTLPKRSMKFVVTVTEEAMEFSALNVSQASEILPLFKDTIKVEEQNLPKLIAKALYAQYKQ